MADESVKPKICILRASIHCEGCKRKVKKILSQVPGVEFVEVDNKQHKVTVTGDVDADTLIKKLVKLGKNAELWPQTPDNTGNKREKEKEKEIKTQKEVGRPEASSTSDNGKPSTTVEKLANKTPHGEGDESGIGGGGNAKTNDVVQPEEKKSDESCSSPAGDNHPPQAAEKSDGGGGTSGKKKKKKKGQSVERGLESQEAGAPPAATNQSPPRDHRIPFAPPPMYAVSYNTAYPASSYAASYYAAPPPQGYAHVHRGREMEQPPLDHELNPPQPLDSFEMFSDENPNGCFIM